MDLRGRVRELTIMSVSQFPTDGDLVDQPLVEYMVVYRCVVKSILDKTMRQCGKDRYNQ